MSRRTGEKYRERNIRGEISREKANGKREQEREDEDKGIGWRNGEEMARELGSVSIRDFKVPDETDQISPDCYPRSSGPDGQSERHKCSFSVINAAVP